MDQQIQRFRGSYRATLFLGVTLYFTTVQILRALAGRRCPLRAAEYGQAWARLLIRVLGVRVEVRGTPPKGPVLEVDRWPVVGLAAKTNSTVFVERESPLNRKQARRNASEHPQKGLAFVAFPEGTTSRAPQVLPFSPGLFHVAQENGFPVCPVAIEYGDPGDAWVGENSFFSHFVRCLGKRRVYVSLAFGPTLRASNAGDLKERAETWIQDNLRAPQGEGAQPAGEFIPDLQAA